MSKSLNFAVCGIGFIFDRHLAAMENIGGKLLCACDILPDQQEKLDSDVKFFENFDTMRKSKFFKDVDVVVICTPNYLHKELAVRSIRAGKNVLLEKPTVISVPELLFLMEEERLSDNEVFTVMQLRESPKLQEMKKEIEAGKGRHKVKIDLKMHRGDFYWDGWKGKRRQSGGLLFNIGVHYFDMLIWMFGEGGWKDFKVKNLGDKKGNGTLKLKHADVVWSIDLTAPKAKQARIVTIDGAKLNLTRILESLHNKVYERLEYGDGITLSEVAPVINLCHSMTETFYEGNNV